MVMKLTSKLGEKCVADLVDRHVIAAVDTHALADAVMMMDSQGLSAVPVVDCHNRVVGILTASDLVNLFHRWQHDSAVFNLMSDGLRASLLQLLMESDESDLCVRDVMTSPVVTVSENTNLVVAAQIMSDKCYHHLPVVDTNGAPVGILSTSDFVRAIAEHGASMAG